MSDSSSLADPSSSSLRFCAGKEAAAQRWGNETTRLGEIRGHGYGIEGREELGGGTFRPVYFR
jgi:hypothetical protein